MIKWVKYLNFHAKNRDFDRTIYKEKRLIESILTSFARKSKLIFGNQSSKYWILDSKVGEIFQFSCQKSRFWLKYAKSKSKWPIFASKFKEFLQWKFKIFRQFEHFIKQNSQFWNIFISTIFFTYFGSFEHCASRADNLTVFVEQVRGKMDAASRRQMLPKT